jgi:hypothetical protein
MTDRITYAEAAELLKLPYTTLRAFRKRIGAPEPVVVTSGTQPALFSKREYEEFMLDHNVTALIAAERYFDKHGVYPNQGDAKPTFNKMASTFLKGAYLPQEAQAKREAMLALAKRNKPKTTRMTIESEWSMKPCEDGRSKGRVRLAVIGANGLPTGVHKTPHNTYRVKIKFNRVEYNLGSYEKLADAVKARNDAEEELRVNGKLSNAVSAVKKGLPKGVQLRPHGVYTARIKHKSVDYNLGTFKTLEEAVAVRREAEKQIKETGKIK